MLELTFQKDRYGPVHLIVFLVTCHDAKTEISVIKVEWGLLASCMHSLAYILVELIIFRGKIESLFMIWEGAAAVHLSAFREVYTNSRIMFR